MPAPSRQNRDSNRSHARFRSRFIMLQSPIREKMVPTGRLLLLHSRDAVIAGSKQLADEPKILSYSKNADQQQKIAECMSRHKGFGETQDSLARKGELTRQTVRVLQHGPDVFSVFRRYLAEQACNVNCRRSCFAFSLRSAAGTRFSSFRTWS